MSEAAYNDALRLLNHLTSDEASKLRDALTALLSLHAAGGAARDEKTPEGVDVAGLVNEVLEGYGFGRVSLHQLQGAAPRYSQTSAQLWAFARTAMPDGKRVEHLAILRLGVRMLYKNIEDQGIPITHNIMMRQLSRLPAVVNHGFPGYARNGFLGLVVRSNISGRRG